MSYAFINQSVGKNGRNVKEDVMSIQIRLNRWIMEGKLPNVPMLAVDGNCGGQTRKAIGAFQKLYVGMNIPDCRVDPGGRTLEQLFHSLISPQASREAYEAWLKAQAAASQKPPMPDVDLTDEEAPYWEKRGMFWFGAGVKVGGMVGPGGYDWLLATMYNLEAPSGNKFILRANTRRTGWGAGGGAGAVIAFVTGIYSPGDLNKIRLVDWDWSLAIAGKWSGLLKWAARAPALRALANSARVAQYADYDLISKAASLVKSSVDGFGLKTDSTEPSFVAMDIPVGGVGMEAAYYRGLTSFAVSDVHLD